MTYWGSLLGWGPPLVPCRRAPQSPNTGRPHRSVARSRTKLDGLTDRYAAQLRDDVAYRSEWCKRAGLGFSGSYIVTPQCCFDCRSESSVNVLRASPGLAPILFT